IENEADQIGRKTHVSVVCQGNRLSYVKKSPDGETRETLTVPQDFGQELETLKSVSRGAIKPGWTCTFSTFDCDLLKIDTVTMTVLEPTTSPRPGWIVTARSGLLGIKTKTWLGRDVTLLRQEVPGMMGMTLALATEAEALAELSPLLLSSSIPVNTDPGAARDLASLTLRASSHSVPVVELIPPTPRQTVTTDGEDILVAVRAQAAPELTTRIPVTQPQLQQYLQPSDLAQSRDPLIVAKAKSIIGDETDAWRAAQKLLAWVHRELAKMESEPRPLSAKEILGEMRGDCTEHAILLAALAQAVGIPSKMCAGLVYDSKAYHYHAWNELYVGQWVEIDATWNQPTVDPGHLLIASGALDSASMGRLSLASGRTMGSLDLDILTVEK
ncbi:MAG: transglutaminase-like domain-containing protein, partial [Bacteroidota bacterium]